MIFSTLAYVFLLGSVSWADIPPAPSPGVSAPPELRLFRACMEKSGGSVMISPFSLYEVLRYIVTAQDSCDMRDRLLRYFALAA